MALYYSLPVFRDVYRLILLLFEHTSDFPREQEHTLGQDITRDSIVLVRSIYRANKAKSKTEYLEAFLDDFEVLKLEIRICVDLKILPMKKQAEIALLMDSIGRQITGWRNAGLQSPDDPGDIVSRRSYRTEKRTLDLLASFIREFAEPRSHV